MLDFRLHVDSQASTHVSSCFLRFDGGEAAVVMTDNGLVSSWCFRSALREARPSQRTDRQQREVMAVLRFRPHTKKHGLPKI